MKRFKYLPAVLAGLVLAATAACTSNTSNGEAEKSYAGPLRPATAEEVAAVKENFYDGSSLRNFKAKYYVAVGDFRTDTITEPTVIFLPRDKKGKVVARWTGGELGHATLLLDMILNSEDDARGIGSAYALYDPICRLVVYQYATEQTCRRAATTDTSTVELTPISKDSVLVKPWLDYTPGDGEFTEWLSGSNGALKLEPALQLDAGREMVLHPQTIVVGGELGHHKLYSDPTFTRFKQFIVADPMCDLSETDSDIREGVVGEFVPEAFMERYSSKSKICPHKGGPIA